MSNPSADENMSSTPGVNEEIQDWIRRLEIDRKLLNRRNVRLLFFVFLGLAAFCIVLWLLWANTTGRYAVLDNISVSQHSASQGRLSISFDVVKPGLVYYQRQSGMIRAERADTFFKPQHVDRQWSWNYQPGRIIELNLWCRRGLLPRRTKGVYPTSSTVDVVILIDTTESMTVYIDQLKSKCQTFASNLRSQTLTPRFALIGYGDRSEGEWVSAFDFTDDTQTFRKNLDSMSRFDGGDLPESALDALELAATLSFEEGSIRRFYLITDADFHELGQSGMNAAAVAQQLQKNRVFLDVFSHPGFESSYRQLIGDSGKFQEIENFGAVFSEGRILED